MPPFEDAQPETEIVIRLVLHGYVARDIAVDERRQGRDRGVLEQLLIAQKGRHFDQSAGDQSCLVDAAERRIAQRRTLYLREGDLPLELGGQPQIVAVEKRDEAALRPVDRGLTGQRPAAVAGLADPLDARVLRRV